MLWKSYFGGSLRRVRCGRATLGQSGITLVSVLCKSYFGLLRDHSGECAVEELLWATQGSLWPACCGLLTDHFDQCAVEELLWATQGSLWPACCGRATLGDSGITLASVLWKS